jgi:hypothetical protein
MSGSPHYFSDLKEISGQLKNSLYIQLSKSEGQFRSLAPQGLELVL